jgi:hypothetical protein
VADALLDLNYLDEVHLAKALAKANNLPYKGGHSLKYDFSELTFEMFEDLLSVGAVPLENHKLAICNPYDDHRGYLDKHLCEREMVVTERSAVMNALRQKALNNLIHKTKEFL